MLVSQMGPKELEDFLVMKGIKVKSKYAREADSNHPAFKDSLILITLDHSYIHSISVWKGMLSFSSPMLHTRPSLAGLRKRFPNHQLFIEATPDRDGFMIWCRSKIGHLRTDDVIESIKALESLMLRYK